MKARMRTVLGISGMVIAGSFSLAGSGCGTLKATFGTSSDGWSIKGKINLSKDQICDLTIGEQLDFDLDSKEFDTCNFDNREYKYFYNIDCLYEEESQQLVLHDDPNWRTYFDGDDACISISPSNGYVFSQLQEGEFKGTFTPSYNDVTGLQDGIVEATLNLIGGAPIPTFDSSRWVSLSRQLFLIKDGIIGSPDPIVLKLYGNASDVFGYLYEVGITNGHAIVDGKDWSVFIDNGGQWADVYIGNILVTTVLLN